MRYIIIIFITLLAISAKAELINREDGTIEDITNDLQWHQSKSPPRMNWSNATTFASNTRYGYDDWRLPTLVELQTLILSTSSPQIDDIFSIGRSVEWSYWSSTILPEAAAKKFAPTLRERYYVVSFLNGINFTAPIQTHHSARPTRDSSNDMLWASGDNMLWSDSDVMYWE